MWSVTASVRVGHWGRVGQVLIETLPGTPEGPKHRSGGHWNKEHSQWIWHCPDTVCWWQGRSYRLSERIRALSKLSDIMCKFMHVWHPPSCHTHSHKYSQSAQRTLDRKDTLSFSKDSRYIVILHSYWQPGKTPSTKTLPEEAVHCVPLKRISYRERQKERGTQTQRTQ